MKKYPEEKSLPFSKKSKLEHRHETSEGIFRTARSKRSLRRGLNRLV